MKSYIIITGSDANFFELAQGTILSIREKVDGQNAFLGFFDLGCTPEQLKWLREWVDVIKMPDWDFDFLQGSDAPIYLKGLIARPFLPRYFPGFDIYCWIDADAWVQTWSSVELFLQGAEQKGLAIVHDASRYNLGQYGHLKNLYQGHYQNLHAHLGEELAEKLFTYPTINAGVFALHREAPHWQVWTDCLALILKNQVTLYSDQIALNWAIYEFDLLKHTELLPEWCNWQCHWFGFDLPLWHKQQNCLVERYLPHTPIGIVHLTVKKHRWLNLATTDGDVAEVSLRYESKAGTLLKNHFLAQSLRQELNLRDINLIIFPDWQQPEDILLLEIAEIIRNILQQPEQSDITLLIHACDISTEEFDDFLSYAMMQLLYEEDLEIEVDNIAAISPVRDLSKSQWNALLSQVQWYIKMTHENYLAVIDVGANNLPSPEIV
ncbi:hypothetical protein V2H45_13880 [Tumidithrix elongata RA019]|uniref:Glycosyl transferase n=1 Tax=Tumidithrix elongata BACA0141 TaxID=2716417 RepID=A0AAW9PXP6_9CYAN|nr:hypothetical protein [Tumidithrix elongata RA019]